MALEILFLSFCDQIQSLYNNNQFRNEANYSLLAVQGLNCIRMQEII